MRKRERERVVKALIQTRELMNSRGKHWGKNFLLVEVNGEPRYCSLGGLNAALGLRQIFYPEQSHLILDEAKIVLAEAILGSPVRSVKHAEGVIAHFNDRTSTRWGDVSRAFRKAAKLAEKRV